MKKYSWYQTWAVFSKASGIAAASRFSGRFSGIENGTVGVASGTGKTGNTKNQIGLQVVLKSIQDLEQMVLEMTKKADMVQNITSVAPENIFVGSSLFDDYGVTTNQHLPQ